MKRITLFGASGSIGGDTLSILRDHPGEFALRALSVHRHTERLADWIDEFEPRRVLITDGDARAAWLAGHPERAAAVLGADAGVADLMGGDEDIVVNGIMGFAGLAATLAALERDLDVALANKESLVCGGDLLRRRRAASRGRLLPVDSEHSALWQLLRGRRPEEIRRVWLTASGGPFRTSSAREMASVTPEQALDHPTWSMGPKITIDSATLVNKGLEVIEASLLFDLPVEKIGVLVHPTSTAHALAEFADRSVVCQMAAPDMRQPILQALAHPACPRADYGALDFTAGLTLSFEPLDDARFPAVNLARRTLALGGTAPLAFNAADETAVAAFLNGEIGFTDIVAAVQAVVEAADWKSGESFEDLRRADERARAMARNWLDARAVDRRTPKPATRRD